MQFRASQRLKFALTAFSVCIAASLALAQQSASAHSIDRNFIGIKTITVDMSFHSGFTREETIQLKRRFRQKINNIGSGEGLVVKAYDYDEKFDRNNNTRMAFQFYLIHKCSKNKKNCVFAYYSKLYRYTVIHPLPLNCRYDVIFYPSKNLQNWQEILVDEFVDIFKECLLDEIVNIRKMEADGVFGDHIKSQFWGTKK